ncbi:MAG TPA: OB-fold nucleic acid binding domain-containing protein, partial [Cytophagaceae bacterium]
MSNFFETKIEFLKGVGPQKAALLQTELKIFTYGDLVQIYPYRYIDRSTFQQISHLSPDDTFIQLKGRVISVGLAGEGRGKRLVAIFSDGTGNIELVWFQGIKFVSATVIKGADLIVFGKLNTYNGKLSIPHPEVEQTAAATVIKGLQPLYSSTEKLRNNYLDSKGIMKLQQRLHEVMAPNINETLPDYLMEKFHLVSKKFAMLNIHFPESQKHLDQARRRLKFEELFYVQLKLLQQRSSRKAEYKGHVLKKTLLLTEFYKNHLPFDLTEAQKKVIKEIYTDIISGKQMNRLLQGDVGSGKTIVAFI